MDRDFPPNPGLDALMIVVAELYGAGLFDGHNLSNIIEKLELSEHAELADRVRMLPLTVAMEMEFRGG